MSLVMLDNEWASSDDRDNAIAGHDNPSIDTRTFSRVTKSQLNSSKAIDKTLRHGHKHRSQCLPYSKATKAQNTLGFRQLKKIKDETSLTATHVLTMKFWNSFQKHSVSLGDDNSSVSSGASVPVVNLQSAICSMTDREISAEISNIIQSLGFRATESLSWKEYKNVCNMIFDTGATAGGSVTGSSNVVGESQSLSQASHHSDLHSRSLSYTSFGNSSSAYDLQSEARLHKGSSYTSLQRKHRGAGSIQPNMSHADVTDFSPLESTLLAPVKKDALCEVVKNEYRKIRKHQLADKDRRRQDAEKRYLQQTQKQKIAAIKNKNCLVPLKWREVNEKRAAREAIIQNYKNRKDMIQAFKTVVNAQERNSINREVLNKDEEAMSKIEDNSMKRYIENEITTRNIKSWKTNEQKVRKETRLAYKEKMAESVKTSRQMIEEEKEFRRFMLNEGNEMGPKKLSSCSSTKFDVPEDIADRLRMATKLSQYEKAKDDSRMAYEQEMSLRINQYNSNRQEAIRRAEDYGQGITLNPLRGEDYFLDDGATTAYSHPVRLSQESSSQYFDSASSIAYPGKSKESSYDASCPPVFLDPNYDPAAPNRSACSHLYNARRNRPRATDGKKRNKVKNTDVVDAIRHYDDDNLGDSVTQNDKDDDDDVSFTDSIGSTADKTDEDHFPLPEMSDTI
mmetsp:Transcript_17038/g.32074  ORF Transcript_17038/g.32074 Transcript_17038/m.32074 type:complete len:679 (-) Transcript_17038:95-2131(-)